MKKLITFGLISLFIVCCTDQIATLPDYWEYSPGKWIAFNNTIELEWRYSETPVDKFKVDRVKVKLKGIEIKKILKLIKNNKIDELLAKEKRLRTKIRWNEKISNYNSTVQMYYIDKIEPEPTFGEIFFYQISAINDHTTSLPAELSVILLDRSK